MGPTGPGCGRAGFSGFPAVQILGNLAIPYTNHWGGERGGSLEPDPSGYDAVVTRNNPSGLHVTELYLAIYPAVIKVPVGTFLLRWLLLYSPRLCEEPFKATI